MPFTKIEKKNISNNFMYHFDIYPEIISVFGQFTRFLSVINFEVDVVVRGKLKIVFEHIFLFEKFKINITFIYDDLN